MRREAVESSSLKSVGDASESQTLEVEFQHGAVVQRRLLTGTYDRDRQFRFQRMVTASPTAP